MKPFRTISILAIISLLGAVGYMAYETFWSPDRVDLAGAGLFEVLKNGDLWKFLLFSVALIGFAVFEILDLRNTPPAEIKDGVAAEARVTEVRDTGVTLNDDPQIKLLLQVAPPGGIPSFQAKANTYVSRLEAARVRPGITAQVRCDPKKPQGVQILSLHLQDAAAMDTGRPAGRT